MVSLSLVASTTDQVRRRRSFSSEKRTARTVRSSSDQHQSRRLQSRWLPGHGRADEAEVSERTTERISRLRFSSTGSAMSVVLQNRACEQDTTSPCTYNRTFTPQTDEIFVLAATNATLAVFFDVLENVGSSTRSRFHIGHVSLPAGLSGSAGLATQSRRELQTDRLSEFARARRSFHQSDG